MEAAGCGCPVRGAGCHHESNPGSRAGFDGRNRDEKIIPLEDIGKYLGDGGRSTIRGYVARYNDVCHLRGYDEVVEAMRLDYKIDGVRPYPEGGDSYGYIKFRTRNVENIEIPFGKAMGGTNTDGYPCGLNGFTASRNGEVVPEFFCIRGKEVKPMRGAELHRVVNGRDTVVGIFDGSHFKIVD